MIPPIKKQIKSIGFGLLNPEQIKNLSVAKIVTPELYDIDGYPVDGGLMDLRMGAIHPGVRCRTCGGRLKECLGHPGSIDLARPIMHLKYIPLIEIGLRCFCQNCGKLMLSDKKISECGASQRIKKSKNAKKCPYCGEANEKIKLDKPTSFYRGKKRLFPTEIREMLEKISDEELMKVGINIHNCRPEWAVLTSLLVPPVTVRPSIVLESGEMSEDDLTHKLSDIIRANQRLWENLNAGAPEVIIEDLWDLLQFHVTTFFDNTVSRIPPARHRSGQPLKTITERIKGKEGRIRKNLAGKRVNYSARTVISPDPYLDINEVGVPYEIAEIVTYAETVTDLNIKKLKELIKQGNKYPGANYIIRPDGKRKKISEELKEEIINEIVPGYKVERHLMDGDIVLFNRHPSLHRGSLMAHYVKVLPGKTFRLHPAVAFPYNADYDGDEMNIHSPQTEEARSEAKTLLNIKSNLISPKNNSNMVGNVKDAITGGYLLGKAELSKEEADQLIFQTGKIPNFSKKHLTGKEVLSELLPKGISYSQKSKSCLGKDCKYYDACKKSKCPNDAYLHIDKGNFESGIVDENTFGVEEGKLVKELDRQVGRDVTFETLKRIFTLGTGYLTNRGISVSVNDFDLDKSVVELSNEVIKKSEQRVQEIIGEYNNNTLEIIPGKTNEQSREIKIIQVLNEVRTKIGQIVKKRFPSTNPVDHMIKSGGGGNMLNITQMACCVGQQALSGRRIDIGFTDRTLSFFKKGDLSPESKGFIKSSFIKGLRPDEFFFGAVTGRDSLMDTALRTPKSGYLYRRLANALQDLRVEYDGTVRDSNNSIIEFKFGGDGLDVSKLHLNEAIDSGEAIGIVTAQSFGESSTQMVLNTFHMAGVAEMQVTTGLPRIIEIFDARKTPSSPKMEIYLNSKYNDEKNAKSFAERIKEVMLEEISSEISLNFTDKTIEVEMNEQVLKRINLKPEKIIETLRDKGYKAKISGTKIKIVDLDVGFKELYQLKEKLRKVIVSGLKGIKQILVVKRDRDFVILTLGTNLKSIFGCREVNPDKTVSNDLHEFAAVLGIEAGRELIIKEIKEVINSQGLDINERHLELIADAMCNTGTVRGVTRMGIIAQKASILARATFETPVKHFVNSTIKGTKDHLTSVVENVILNQPVPVGTGLPGLLVKVIGPLVKREEEKKTASKASVKKAKS